MASKPKAYVLDSWSVMTFLEDEPAGEMVGNIIGDAHEQGIPLMMTTVNAGEVWYILAREVSEAAADQIIKDMRELGIEFQDTDWKLANQAAQFKAVKKMSFADCFAAALTFQHEGSVLVTGDKEFKQVEESIKIRWLVNN
ncbi:MAG: type II toxin-antitoxin system VapC family toxin [Bacteroidota bacterium]